MRIYLASGFNRRYHLRTLAESLIDIGHEIISRWIWIEERPERESNNWQEFAQNIAIANLMDLRQAEIIIVDAYGIRETNNGGTSTELGYGIAKDLPIYIIGEMRNTFSHLEHIIKVNDYSALLSFMKVQYGIKSRA